MSVFHQLLRQRIGFAEYARGQYRCGFINRFLILFDGVLLLFFSNFCNKSTLIEIAQRAFPKTKAVPMSTSKQV